MRTKWKRKTNEHEQPKNFYMCYTYSSPLSTRSMAGWLNGWMAGMVNFLLPRTYKLRFFIASPYGYECLGVVYGLRLYVDEFICRAMFVIPHTFCLPYTLWRVCIHPKLHERICEVNLRQSEAQKWKHLFVEKTQQIWRKVACSLG